MTVTAKTSGIPDEFITKIALIAKDHCCFILIRPVNKLSTALLQGLIIAKGLDIHGKSADWGPQAGYIPFDSSLSKMAGGKEGKIKKAQKENDEALKKSNISKKKLTIEVNRFNDLKKSKLLPDELEVNSECICKKIDPCSKKVLASQKFLLKRDSDDKTKLHVQIWVEKDKKDGKGKEWVWDDVWVMGYGSGKNVTAVTADLDLFAVCPHYSLLKSSSECRTGTKNGMGFITPFEEKIVKEINDKCGKMIVLHGAENHNIKYVQDAKGSRKLTVFCPSGGSVMMNLPKFANANAALLKRGFVARVNPSWRTLNDQLIDVKGKVAYKVLSPQVRGDRSIPKPLLESHFAGKKALPIGDTGKSPNLKKFLDDYVDWG